MAPLPPPPQAGTASLVADLMLTCPTLVSSTKAYTLRKLGSAGIAAAGSMAVRKASVYVYKQSSDACAFGHHADFIWVGRSLCESMSQRQTLALHAPHHSSSQHSFELKGQIVNVTCIWGQGKYTPCQQGNPLLLLRRLQPQNPRRLLQQHVQSHWLCA